MKKGSDLLGLPVYTKKNGNKIAEVKEIIYSKQKLRILGILIEEKGFFKDAKFIKFKNIDMIGKDAIMISDTRVVEIANSSPEIYEHLIDNDKIIGKEVFTEEGESLGFIQDIIIDEERGKILGFILTEGIIQDIVNGRNILPFTNGITFGENVLILDRRIKEEFLKNKKEFKKLLELH